MAPQPTPLSPAELSYLHTSLSHHPPLRPDLRTPRQFRPLSAEPHPLPHTNGSARVRFPDGSEALCGIKAESVPTVPANTAPPGIEVSIDIPGARDDDKAAGFLARLLAEAVLATLPANALRGGRSWGWRLYVDILLHSPPLSYPLPLLSLTTHLALRVARLPRVVSEEDEEPLFDDDWEAATFLYPSVGCGPPVTLLVMAVGGQVVFDPAREEVAVAEALVAVSVCEEKRGEGRGVLRLLGVRMLDLPARQTPRGGEEGVQGVWVPPRGGVKRELVERMVAAVVEGEEAVAWEVLDGLAGVL
ncbi:MAG: hypothetical protein M1829_006672 [Trizodia sp. TS-e1964]|nr:MAG: hypothetical protein M1829_006672 [Trizodia sp. TS-e1964]